MMIIQIKFRARKIKVKFTRDSSVKNTLSVDSTDKLTPVSSQIGHPGSRGDEIVINRAVFVAQWYT